MVHQLPKPVAQALAARYQASLTASALYQEELALVTLTLGIPEGVKLGIDFDKGVIEVPEPIDKQESVHGNLYSVGVADAPDP